jgi:mono/diheme cytochrome c family protein
LASVFAVVLLAVSSAWAQSAPPRDSAQYAATLNRYCVGCHNDKQKTANLSLEKLDLASVPAYGEAWEKVIRKLRTGAMPPTGAPRPDKQFYDQFSSYLESSLDKAFAAHVNPGRPAAVHRLNRAEYANAVRDLLAVEVDALDLLPPDESTNGFDNNGDVLSVSPVLLERYMTAARKIARQAVGDPQTKPYYETYSIDKSLRQEGRMGDGLPFGTRGGEAVHHFFPLDGNYSVRIRMTRDYRDRIRGLQEPHQLDVRLDGKLIKSFIVGGEKHGRSASIFSTGATADPAQEHYELNADDQLQVMFPADTGTHTVAVAFVESSYEPEGPLQPINSRPQSLDRLPLGDYVAYKGGEPGVDEIIVGGPFSPSGVGNSPSREKIFICHPDRPGVGGVGTGPPDAVGGWPQACAKHILTTLAHRAFRRPVTQQETNMFDQFYVNGARAGGFEAGIQMGIERILVGPEFLFRVYKDPAGAAPGTAYRLTDLELASRLSFFLWSSIPDDELRAKAEAGKLHDPAVLEQQTRRMLADKRSRTLVDNFAESWLYLRNLRSMKPDPDAFPEWDENLREAFDQETALFFENLIREDRSVLELLSANYTFLNDRLARHYGIPGVYGGHFRKVALNDGPGNNRPGGLLGQGSVLTVTSYANRTSPVLRGKWVLENLLGSPPPPPPANVPSLVDKNKKGKVLSVRQRMEQHRANPACAGCHSRMDPLGFALENFDGLGKWRTTDSETAIDPSGVLPDGTKFDGPLGLKKVLMTKQEEFTHTFAEKLLTYAIGRGLEYTDAPMLRQILHDAAKQNYKLSAFVAGVVASPAFQMRRAE